MKKIEVITSFHLEQGYSTYPGATFMPEASSKNILILQNKINELVEEVNRLREENKKN